MTEHDLVGAAAFQTVVLEGCDGAGKTTFASLLAEHHGFRVVHCSRTPDDVDLVARYEDILAEPGLLVLDRCFLSELVYGPRYRGQSRIGESQAVDLIRRVASRNGIFVYLTGEVSCIHARLIARDGGHAPFPGEIEEIVRAYQQVFAVVARHAPVVSIDTTALGSPRDPIGPL